MTSGPRGTTEALKDCQLVGETIPLGNYILQRPTPAIINALQSIDPRVKYLPTDLEKARSAEDVYFEIVAGSLPSRIEHDFPGNEDRTRQRGTVISLRDEFPFFESGMNNVLTILATGSDRGGVLGNLGWISRGSVAGVVPLFAEMHTFRAIKNLAEQEEYDRANNLFPGILVYEDKLLGDTSIGTPIEDPQALLAIYITDRVLPNTTARIPFTHDQLHGLGAVAVDVPARDAE
jgi:hypothetical protein